ncbi:uncharacterized protein [Onthophagus taurus]|uniref:uncharacterized protein n=1 Tax=Onthophagus taurus TaxID=166361 RepID=UPI0039BEB597
MVRSKAKLSSSGKYSSQATRRSQRNINTANREILSPKSEAALRRPVVVLERLEVNVPVNPEGRARAEEATVTTMEPVPGPSSAVVVPRLGEGEIEECEISQPGQQTKAESRRPYVMISQRSRAQADFAIAGPSGLQARPALRIVREEEEEEEEEELRRAEVSARASQPSTRIRRSRRSPIVMQPSRQPQAGRRRHAEIPHKVTYRKALTLNESVETAVALYNIGVLDDVCRHCNAKYFTKEITTRSQRRMLCCKDGDVRLPELRRCPEEIRRLLVERDAMGRNYRENIRAINGLFAMASFTASIPDGVNVGQGAWSFTICGQIYHFANPIPDAEDFANPRGNQYYFIDADDAIERRMQKIGDRVVREVVDIIENTLRRDNVWVSSYRTVKEVLEERRRVEGVDVENVVVGFKKNIRDDLRTHNLPESRSDVAAVFVGNEPPFDVDLKIYPKSRNAQHELKNLNKLADPMVYPLLFPYGEYGCDVTLRHQLNTAKNVTIREFYKYRLQCREEFSILHNSGKLFQQYIVDAWVRAEASELWYLKQNQERFRLVSADVVRRRLEDQCRGTDTRIGKIWVLPTSHTGSIRYKNRKYLEALAMVARHGKPDLFITMTCNPKWDEIQNNLEYAQKYEHRPDLVARVFKTKLNEFIDDIVNKQLYGVVLNYMYTIEFQKRGLPHAHILVTMRPEDKFEDVESIDKLISARLPDENEEPVLHRIVADCYIHRPCGQNNPGASCMRDGACTKRYPKDFCEETILHVGHIQQPQYRRPYDGRSIQMGDVVIDNRSVVPYSRYAAMKYKCHINFEICGSLASVKYLHKYVHKGPDCITIESRNERNVLEWNEIDRYLECRYVSSMEAVWRLFEFKLNDKSHSVVVLAVHMPNEQTFIVDDDAENADFEAALRKPTKLMAYFRLNQIDPDARDLKYPEIPEHYVWEDRDGSWRRRSKRCKVIGVMMEVSPTDMEKFYLRMLLAHVAGATSFEALRTVNETVCETFQEACRRMGLLERVDEYDRCMIEAANNAPPKRLRRLFALICLVAVDNAALELNQLWLNHRMALMDDFLYAGNDESLAEAKALREIEEQLLRNGKTLQAIGLPSVDEEALRNARRTADEDVAGEEEQQEEIRRSLNGDQLRVFDEVTQEIEFNMVGLRTGRNLFYVDGPGGTGKTFLYNTLLKYVLRRYRKSVIAVAWTGIAAVLLENGKTVHRAFKLPLQLNEDSVSGFAVDSPESAFIRDDVQLIVWDEAPMSPIFALHAVDRYLKDVMRSDRPMGGKVCVFGGDFRQVLPVIPRARNAEILAQSLINSYLWNKMRHMKLTVNMRVLPDQIEFREWLLKLGENKLPHINMPGSVGAPDDLVEIPRRCLTANLELLLRKIFGQDLLDEDLSNRAVLCPTNDSVHEVNEKILDSIVGESKTYYSVDEYHAEPGDEFHVPLDYLNSVKSSSLPPHELRVKAGVVVMLLRNLDLEGGLCNGTRLKVLRMFDHQLELEILTGACRNDIVRIPKVKVQVKDSTLPRPMTRFQFPVRLAFAMTINKAQGQTFSKVGVYLKEPCFAHGQLYVACSRVGRYDDLYFHIENGVKQGAFKYRNGRKFTRNVVFQAAVTSSRCMAMNRTANVDLYTERDVEEAIAAAERIENDDEERRQRLQQQIESDVEELSSSVSEMSVEDTE